MTRHWSVWLSAGSITLLGAIGCASHNSDANVAARKGAAPTRSSTAPKSTGQKLGARKPGAPLKMTKTQTVGVDIVMAISRDPKLKGARISVGTTSNSVSLDGTILKPEQSKAAEAIAHQKAPGYKLTNRLKLAAAPAPKAK